MGLRAEAEASTWPLACGEAGCAWAAAAACFGRLRRLNTCTVPLSEDRASQSGCSPLEKARLYIQAGSAPLLSSCAHADELKPCLICASNACL